MFALPHDTLASASRARSHGWQILPSAIDRPVWWRERKLGDSAFDKPNFGWTTKWHVFMLRAAYANAYDKRDYRRLK